MPGNPRAIVADAERQFPVRIVIKVPSGGIGQRYVPFTEWLDEKLRHQRLVDYACRHSRRDE
jgi:hypothetical protein